MKKTHQTEQNNRFRQIKILLALGYLGYIGWFMFELSQRRFDPITIMIVSLSFYAVLAILNKMEK